MLDKFPNDLTSEVVVARWVRQWNLNAAVQSTNDTKQD
jgi:hypothetical protein